MAAIERLRAEVTASASRELVEQIAEEIERTISLMRFHVRDQREGPYHHIDFHGDLPMEPTGPMFAGFSTAREASDDPALLALLEALDALQRSLIYEAHCQQYVDSKNNMKQFLTAAGHLDSVEPLVVGLAHSIGRR